MSKWLKRVNILADKSQIQFYDKSCELAWTWRPSELIGNFENMIQLDFEKYEELNAQLKDLLMHV